MPLLSSFDPQAFFESTALYASQSRGILCIRGDLPKIFTSSELTTTDKAHVRRGFDLLSQGLHVSQMNIPTQTLAAHENYTTTNGPTRKMPHTQVFQDLSVDFYLMGKTKEDAQSLYHTFVLWHQLIGGGRFGTTLDRTPDPDATPFAVAYYDDIHVTLEAEIYAPTVDVSAVSLETYTPIPIVHNKYWHAYPIAIGSLNTGADLPDAPLTLTVTFTFFYCQSIL